MNKILKHNIRAVIIKNVILKHNIVEAVIKNVIFKHGIIDAFLLTVKRTLRLNDTSKTITFNTTKADITSEGT